MVFDALSDAVRAAVNNAHPVPIRRLVEFERVTIDAGATAAVPFTIPREALSLVTKDGSRKLYAGAHNLVFSRGNGMETQVTVVV